MQLKTVKLAFASLLAVQTMAAPITAGKPTLTVSCGRYLGPSDCGSCIGRNCGPQNFGPSETPPTHCTMVNTKPTGLGRDTEEHGNRKRQLVVTDLGIPNGPFKNMTVGDIEDMAELLSAGPAPSNMAVADINKVGAKSCMDWAKVQYEDAQRRMKNISTTEEFKQWLNAVRKIDLPEEAKQPFNDLYNSVHTAVEKEAGKTLMAKDIAGSTPGKGPGKVDPTQKTTWFTKRDKDITGKGGPGKPMRIDPGQLTGWFGRPGWFGSSQQGGWFIKRHLWQNTRSKFVALAKSPFGNRVSQGPEASANSRRYASKVPSHKSVTREFSKPYMSNTAAQLPHETVAANTTRTVMGSKPTFGPFLNASIQITKRDVPKTTSELPDETATATKTYMPNYMPKQGMNTTRPIMAGRPTFAQFHNTSKIVSPSLVKVSATFAPKHKISRISARQERDQVFWFDGVAWTTLTRKPDVTPPPWATAIGATPFAASKDSFVNVGVTTVGMPTAMPSMPKATTTNVPEKSIATTWPAEWTSMTKTFYSHRPFVTSPPRKGPKFASHNQYRYERDLASTEHDNKVEAKPNQYLVQDMPPAEALRAVARGTAVMPANRRPVLGSAAQRMSFMDAPYIVKREEPMPAAVSDPTRAVLDQRPMAAVAPAQALVEQA